MVDRAHVEASLVGEIVTLPGRTVAIDGSTFDEKNVVLVSFGTIGNNTGFIGAVEEGCGRRTVATIGLAHVCHIYWTHLDAELRVEVESLRNCAIFVSFSAF